MVKGTSIMNEIFVEIYIQLIKWKILKTDKNSIDFFNHSHNAPCSPAPILQT